MFDREVWDKVPFHFWSVTLFIFGSMVGSFLNVCIYRMPRGESVVSPPSHCPHCGYSIPWYLNMPLITWLWLRGRCAHCGAPISLRYFAVELLTGLAFLACWLSFGDFSAGVALVYCLVLAGLIVATFIDFEHFIIPDEITIGGMVAGFLLSWAVPALHRRGMAGASLRESAIGMMVGGGMLLAIVQVGKWVFGRRNVALAPGSRITFTESVLVLPEEEIPYEEIFSRQSDAIRVHAATVELPDRGYRDVAVRLTPERLQIGEEVIAAEEVLHMEVVAERIVLPREAMGLGDVKFMAAIGAFLGWPATLFSLFFSSVIGAGVGLALIALGKREWSSRLPYGPYIALAAVLWIFAGRAILGWFLPGGRGW